RRPRGIDLGSRRGRALRDSRGGSLRPARSRSARPTAGPGGRNRHTAWIRSPAYLGAELDAEPGIAIPRGARGGTSGHGPLRTRRGRLSRIHYSHRRVYALMPGSGDVTALPLPLLMLIVFGSARLFAESFERLGQPAIAGEILAGVVIGPSLLNWVQPQGLVLSLADLGVMFLLFRVGLEIQSSEMVRIGGRAALVAAAGVTLSFGLVWGVMTLRGFRLLEAAFVSAALAATSVGITAQVLTARGLLANAASQVVLAAAVIDDVCGLLVLAVVSSLARGEVHPAEIAVTLLAAAAFIFIVANWGSTAMRRLVPAAGDRLRIAEAEFAVALCLLFGLALLSLWTGIAAIVGAFLAG